MSLTAAPFKHREVILIILVQRNVGITLMMQTEIHSSTSCRPYSFVAINIKLRSELFFYIYIYRNELSHEDTS